MNSPCTATLFLRCGSIPVEGKQWVLRLLDAEERREDFLGAWCEPETGDPVAFRAFSRNPFEGLWLCNGVGDTWEKFRGQFGAAGIDEIRLFYRQGCVHVARANGGYRLASAFEKGDLHPESLKKFDMDHEEVFKTLRVKTWAALPQRGVPGRQPAEDSEPITVVEYLGPDAGTLFWRIR